MQHNKNNPLVSIIVITYNSAKFVLETLESAKSQTYKNIELIISDDGSTDNTVELCREWLQRNKERFVRTQLINVEQNTGIPANCNRGLKAAQGEWVKFIAGDDVLMDTCIESNIVNINKNSDIEIQFSRLIPFKIIDSKIETYNDKFLDNNLKKYLLSNEMQYEALLENNFVSAPTSFINRELIKKIGGFDESIKGIEDYPFWLKASKIGIKFHFFECETVKYRRHENNSSIPSKMLLLERKVFFKYIFFELFQRNPVKVYNKFIYYLFIPLIIKSKYFKLFYILSPMIMKSLIKQLYLKRHNRNNENCINNV